MRGRLLGQEQRGGRKRRGIARGYRRITAYLVRVVDSKLQDWDGGSKTSGCGGEAWPGYDRLLKPHSSFVMKKKQREEMSPRGTRRVRYHGRAARLVSSFTGFEARAAPASQTIYLWLALAWPSRVAGSALGPGRFRMSRYGSPAHQACQGPLVSLCCAGESPGLGILAPYSPFDFCSFYSRIAVVVVHFGAGSEQRLAHSVNVLLLSSLLLTGCYTLYIEHVPL